MSQKRIDASFNENFRQMLAHAREAPPTPTPGVLGTDKLPDSDYHQRIDYLLQRIPHGARVLDLGCGYGHMLHFLKNRRGAEVLGLEHSAERVAECLRIGVPALQADCGDPDDANLRYALSQNWDVVMAIDTIFYWRFPAVIVAALAPKVKEFYVTVANATHFKNLKSALRGEYPHQPNSRTIITGEAREIEFNTGFTVHYWTSKTFPIWAQALGYSSEMLARRSVSAKYLPLPPLPSLFCRSLLFKLTPKTIVV